MKKEDLKEAVKAAKAETRAALETLYAALNHGQKQKLIKNEAVLELFDRYEVNYE